MMIQSVQFVALVDRVAHECQVQPRDILSKSRRAEVSDARAICVYCARQLWGFSYPCLGKMFRRTPSTALYLDTKIRMIVEYDDRVATIVDKVLENAA